jgi:hypothetical protein
MTALSVVPSLATLSLLDRTQKALSFPYLEKLHTLSRVISPTDDQHFRLWFTRQCAHIEDQKNLLSRKFKATYFPPSALDDIEIATHRLQQTLEVFEKHIDDFFHKPSQLLHDLQRFQSFYQSHEDETLSRHYIRATSHLCQCIQNQDPKLNFRHLKISALPDSLFGPHLFLQFTSLNLSGTSFEHLPEALSLLGNLSMLYLNDMPHLKGLPAFLSRLEHLTLIELQQSVPTETFSYPSRATFESLHTLTLKNLPFQGLPDFLKNCTALKILKIKLPPFPDELQGFWQNLTVERIDD